MVKSIRLRRRVVIGAAAVVTAGAVAVVTMPAHADEITMRLRNVATSDCLESFLQSVPDWPGYVYSEPCPPQGVKWRAVPAELTDGPGDAVQLIDAETGWCLDSNGADVYTKPCQPGNGWQAWTLGSGNSIRHVIGDGCLTDDDARAVRVTECTSDPHQQWPQF